MDGVPPGTRGLPSPDGRARRSLLALTGLAVAGAGFFVALDWHLGVTLSAQVAAPGELPPSDEVSPLDEAIAAVEIEGNTSIPTEAIRKYVKIRPGRAATKQQIDDDIRALYGTKWFLHVEPHYRRADEGLVLTFKVLERPIVQRVQFIGNSAIKTKKLQAETGLKPGSPFDVSINREAARRLVDVYKEKGYQFVQVELERGGQRTDRDVVFRITEGPHVKVAWRSFEGNDTYSSGILVGKLQTKPAVMWLVGGNYDPSTLPNDKAAITQYYHNLGHFDVKVEEKIDFQDVNWIPWDKNRQHATITYVINEGPRYKVRNVDVMGNQVIPEETLRGDMKMVAGELFNARYVNQDVQRMLDMYGAQGRLFAKVEPVPRFLEEPGVVDLVYRIDEDKPYRIRRIDVAYKGEYPHSRRSLVWNQLNGRVAPGELANPRNIERSKRQIAGSGYFERNVQVSVKPVEFSEELKQVRGQSEIPESGTLPLPVSQLETRGVAPVGQISNLPVKEDLHGQIRNLPHENLPRSASGEAPHATPPSPPLPRGGAKQAVPQPAPATGPSAQRLAKPVAVAGDARLGGWQVGQRHTVQMARREPSGELRLLTVPETTRYARVPSPDLVADDTVIFRAQNYGDPTQQPDNPLFVPSPQGDPLAPGTRFAEPESAAEGQVDLEYMAEEARTGRLMFGVGVNSDAGVVGSIVLSEQNFDITRVPTSFQDVLDGTAFRGAGQRFRAEIVPGTVVSRYLVNWTDPYFLDSDYSLGLSGFYFNRFYPDWDEERAGGRVTVGRQWTPEISTSAALRLEHVEISDPDFPAPQLLLDVLGDNFLSSVILSAAYDDRDSAMLPSEGRRVVLSFEQAFGDFEYPRVEAEARQYFTVYSRPDGGGRHIVMLGAQGGWTGDDTPIFERFFAGGFQTFRGFNFRGVGPKQGAVRVGGEFMAIGTVEYLFPLLANEMVHGVLFSDFGTVEEEVAFNDFRASIGAGFRLSVPALGPVPLAFDFAYPILREEFDDKRIFSFYVGLTR